MVSIPHLVDFRVRIDPNPDVAFRSNKAAFWGYNYFFVYFFELLIGVEESVEEVDGFFEGELCFEAV